MHGRNRAEYKSRLLDPTISAGMAKRAATWFSLSSHLAERCSQGMLFESSDGSEKSLVMIEEKILQLTEKLLKVNPDPGHLWNIRRDILLRRWNTSTGNGDDICIDRELDLASCGIGKNPKAYAAWFHRKWSVRQYVSYSVELERDVLARTRSDSITKDRRQMSSIGRRTGVKIDVIARKLRDELARCGDLLVLDGRNFHCWNFRRFIVSLEAVVAVLAAKANTNESNGSPVAIPFRGLDGSWDELLRSTVFSDEKYAPDGVAGSQLAPQSQFAADGSAEPFQSSANEIHIILRSILTREWDFTTEKILQNFSNCSAFHYRSTLLPIIVQLRAEKSTDSARYYELKLKLAQDELQMVQQAVYTEPDDQTPWWYHRFLIEWAAPHESLTSVGKQRYYDLLEIESKSMRDLLTAEDGRCKWGLLSLRNILLTMMTHPSAKEVDAMSREASSCLRLLMRMDQDRKWRYAGMIMRAEAFDASREDL